MSKTDSRKSVMVKKSTDAPEQNWSDENITVRPIRRQST